MSDDPRGATAYVLEKTYDGQMEWSLLFVFSQREHIRAVLTSMYVDNPDQDVLESQVSDHLSGETADLWLIEHGRRTGHVDLRPMLEETEEETIAIDWPAFDKAVPATLAGSPLRHGEELVLLDAAADFGDTESELRHLYPETPVSYGMQVWVDGEMSDQPYEILPDPDPA